jgi:hypothetical protein
MTPFVCTTAAKAAAVEDTGNASFAGSHTRRRTAQPALRAAACPQVGRYGT